MVVFIVPGASRRRHRSNRQGASHCAGTANHGEVIRQETPTAADGE